MKLVLKHFGKIVKESLLEEGREYFIGRQEDCDFILKGEAGLSRKHVRVYQSDETGAWCVESLSEWGGLYKEGEEIEALQLDQSCSFTLKNYILDFIKEEDQKKEAPAEEKDSIQDLDFQPEIQEMEEGTRVLSDSELVYSLYIYIEGEISDHISLNEGQSWIIGRSEECDFSVDYDILTRKHMQISKVGGKVLCKRSGKLQQNFF